VNRTAPFPVSRQFQQLLLAHQLGHARIVATPLLSRLSAARRRQGRLGIRAHAKLWMHDVWGADHDLPAASKGNTNQG
jgi:hypothetical protein